MNHEAHHNPIESRDYSSQEFIHHLLEVGDQTELMTLAEKFGLSIECVNLCSEFAKLRQRMKVEMSKAVDSRVAGEFNPSPEERSLGAYKEVLEPQVRDAVLLLRKKGYSTYESGFVVPGVTQNIKSFDRVFEGVIIPDTLIECLASDGVKLEVSPNEIFLHFDKFISLEEIKRIWDMVANALPDLGHIITPKMPNATKTDLSGFLVE